MKNLAYTCSWNHVKQHLHLAGEQCPGAVGELPADQVALLAAHDHLAKNTLGHPQVGLPGTWTQASARDLFNMHQYLSYLQKNLGAASEVTHREGRAASVFVSSTQSHPPSRPRRWACVCKIACKRTSCPKSCTPVNRQKHKSELKNPSLSTCVCVFAPWTFLTEDLLDKSAVRSCNSGPVFWGNIPTAVSRIIPSPMVGFWKDTRFQNINNHFPSSLIS